MQKTKVGDRTEGPQKVLEYVKKFKRHNDGNSPSLRMICQACHIASTSTAMYYLVILEERGLIRLPGGFRNIHVIGGHWTCNGGGT